MRKRGNGKKKVVQKTGKEIYNCPFEIRYGFKDCGVDQFHRNNKTPMVSFPCVITFSNCAHTCPCTPSSMWTMMKQTGKSSIDLEGVVHIVKLLRGKPDTPNVSLRPLLQRSLPNHHWSSDAIKNFRQRAQKCVIEPQPEDETLFGDAKFLMKPVTLKMPAYMDVSDILRSPSLAANYHELLRKCLEGGLVSFQTFKCLEEVKKCVKGFDFCVRQDGSGRPTAVVVMTPEMRENSCKHGKLICLDAQRRQQNEHGWPYIGPVSFDNNKQMVILAECACFAETNETYAWILRAMQEMEPRFKMCNITMMFSDEGVTVGLLQKLGIKDSCMLCADEWHMMNEVWPDKFGGHWKHVVNYLRTYIHHPDTVTCNESLQKALDHPGIRANPEMVEEIYRVHRAAKRCASTRELAETEIWAFTVQLCRKSIIPPLWLILGLVVVSVLRIRSRNCSKGPKSLPKKSGNKTICFIWNWTGSSRRKQPRLRRKWISLPSLFLPFCLMDGSDPKLTRQRN